MRVKTSNGNLLYFPGYYLVFLFLFVSVFCYFMWPSDLSENMNANYLNLIISMFMYQIVITMVFLNRKVDIFEPILLIAILHYFLYVVAPIRSIWADDTIHKAGTDTFGGCIKGTWIAFIVFVCIVLIYEISNQKSFQRLDRTNILNWNSSHVLVLSYILWCVGFMSTLAYLSLRGISLAYIVSLGSSGSFNEDLVDNFGYAFLSVIGNLMFASWMFIYALSRKRLVKGMLFVLTLLCLIVRGFRIFIVILCLAPIVFRYMKKKMRPSLKTIALVLALNMLIVGIIGWSRVALRTNNLENLDSFSVESIPGDLIGNLDIYKTYYGVVLAVPEHMNYTYGQQMISYTLLMLVPRAIWSSKPQPISRELLGYSLNKYAVVAGSAYPAIGEWYHEFGFIGCCIIAFFCGYLLKRMWVRYRNDDTVSGLISYALIFSSLLQFVIRGYTPTNFWMIISLMVPIWVINYCCAKHEIKGPKRHGKHSYFYQYSHTL